MGAAPRDYAAMSLQATARLHKVQSRVTCNLLTKEKRVHPLTSVCSSADPLYNEGIDRGIHSVANKTT